MFRYLKITVSFYFLFCSIFEAYSQDKFQILGNKKHESISFKMINNLIVLPVEVNGSTLNFLLDTGVNNTIMFNLKVEDSLKLKGIQKVQLNGLGKGVFIDAVKSNANFFNLGTIQNSNHMVYLIPGKEFELSSKMGITINGIIGGDLFRDFIVDVNYTSKRVKFYDPKKYNYKNCKKCQIYDLHFYKKKPYLYLEIET